MSSPTFDVAIVGLGVMGAASAWQLARRGRRVVAFDRHRPPHALGSSHGGTRIIREAYFEHPQYVPLVRRAYDLWAELERETSATLLQTTGGLMIGPPDGALVRGARLSAGTHGLPCEEWSRDTILERVPALSPPAGAVGVREPRAGVLHAERAVEVLIAEATRAGADVRVECPVTAWTADPAGVRVETAGGSVFARQLVLAAGPWLSAEAPRLGVEITVERTVQYWFADPGDPPLFAPHRFPVFILEFAPDRMLYGLPDVGAGVKLALHYQGVQTTADAVDRVVHAEEIAAMRDVLRRYVPGADAVPAATAVCLYTNTPDLHFVIDRHPRLPAALVVSPCSGHGFKFAPAIGEMVADLVDGRPPAVDQAPFALSRFPPKV